MSWVVQFFKKKNETRCQRSFNGATRPFRIKAGPCQARNMSLGRYKALTQHCGRDRVWWGSHWMEQIQSNVCCKWSILKKINLIEQPKTKDRQWVEEGTGDSLPSSPLLTSTLLSSCPSPPPFHPTPPSPSLSRSLAKSPLITTENSLLELITETPFLYPKEFLEKKFLQSHLTAWACLLLLAWLGLK